ncbi:MAG TPA: hypothetical protein VNO22_00650 [Planctomycetota bacterium]|nr:hypothetical protein [Planctomycetota bacterium]
MRAFILLLPLLTRPADGERLTCTADTALCLGEGEELVNGGARASIRLKGILHLMLLDFDVTPLRGRTVEEARLFLHPTGPHKLRRLGLSTVSSPWTEGRGAGEPARAGETCFREAARGERPWAPPDLDFHAVSFGRGGSIWFVREIRSEPDGWISVDLPPALLHARVEGKSFGLVLSDESGQSGANNDIYAREQSGKAPYIRILRARPGAPPPSGARLYSDLPRPQEKQIADRTAEFLRPAPKPAPPPPARLADGCSWKILYEDHGSPDAPAAGRLWDGRAVSLAAARGEHVGFLIAVEVPAGQTRTVSAAGEGWSVAQVLPVGTGYDPLVPAAGTASGKVLLHAERYVPKDAPAGEFRHPLRLSTGRAQVDIPVSLRVHASRLPDALSFRVSLNAYRSPGEWAGPGGDFLAMERAAHRLAHEHRATLSVLPYTHRGSIVHGMAPEIRRRGADVEIVSWDAWDARFGPLLDGSAFQGLPRAGTPVDHFYLPLHEQWPLPINEFYAYRGPIEDHWRDAPPIEQAFPESYARTLKSVTAAFGRHLAARGWTRTDYHLYLNNKNYIRYNRGEKEGAWWCLDEPMYLEDFLALRYFGRIFKEGAREAAGARLRFRIDLSRPQWRRDLLDGVVDLDVVSGAYVRYPHFVFGIPGEEVWVYGAVAAPPTPPGSGRAWVLQSFLDGADGVVPWLALGTPEAWSEPSETALLLPPRAGLDPRPYPTLRLKLLRRGQQDAEILRLLMAKRGWTREEIRRGLAAPLGLAASYRQAGADDAGRFDFGNTDPDRFEALRRAALEALDRP